MIVAGILLLAGIVLMFISKRSAYVLILSAMLIIPAYWTVMTTVASPDQNLPTAYNGGNQQDGRARQQDGGRNSNVNPELITYLQANTQDVEYLVAVPSSMQGSPMVIATGRPVLLMGGFGGQDDVVDSGDLAQMIANHELRYVLYGGERGNKQEIAAWLKTSCAVVPEFASVSAGRQAPPAQNQSDGQNQPKGQQEVLVLYLCQ